MNKIRQEVTALRLGRERAERLREIARGNIERHLGDCESEDEIFDQAFILGLDALVDAGISLEEAGPIAKSVAQAFAQP